jgi:hypothetical protein
MSDLQVSPDRRRLSAAELRKLPASERAAILEAQAKVAEELYRRDRELTDFEAFGEEDLHGDGAHPEEG